MTRSSRERSQEERKAALMAAIDALPVTKGKLRGDLIPASTDFRRGAFGIVIQAARERRMSVGAFMRRAAYAFACHDLEIPLSEALTLDPRVTRETGFALEDPDGVKFGPWEIESLKEPGP